MRDLQCDFNFACDEQSYQHYEEKHIKSNHNFVSDFVDLDSKHDFGGSGRTEYLPVCNKRCNPYAYCG